MSSNIFENEEGEHISTPGSSRNVYTKDNNSIDDFSEDISLHLSSDDGDSYIDDLEESEEEELQQVQFSSSSESEEDGFDDLDENFDFREALRSAGNFRSKGKRKSSAASKSYWRRKMIRSTNMELDPEVRINLSRANEAFVKGDYTSALSLYLEVIKKDSKNFSAYKTLGEIYKQQGQLHKCCNSWLLAANIHPWDSEFWANVAELSSQLGHLEQAIYCYGKAISSDKSKNPKYIIERALLYKEAKQFGRALEAFQKVHQMYPTDTNIIKNLASIYVDQRRVKDAIKLYMELLVQNMASKNEKKKNIPKFSWAELNILCELYIQKHSWALGIKTIKLVSRWIQDRQDEVWWDEVDDDSEFDNRRFEVLKSLSLDKKIRSKKKYFELPIDIRFKLGYLRLGLGQKDEAMRHFEYLLQEVEDISDLFFESGKALEAHGFYEDALTFLTRASDSEQQAENSELIALLGKCFQEVGDFQQAEQAYRSVLFGDPKNLDIKLALAEVLYHLGDEAKSIDLLEEVSKAAKASSKDKETAKIIAKDDKVDEEIENLSLIKNKKLIKHKNAKLSEEEKLELEENATRNVLNKYRRMERLYLAVLKNDVVAIKTWIQLASQLLEVFMSVKAFFPRDKNRAFKGIVFYKRKQEMGLDEKLARLLNLHEGIGDEELESHVSVTSTTEYRGISYDSWFSIFVNYVILLYRTENNLEYSMQVIDVAKDVNVFVQDKVKEGILNIIKLFIGIKREDMSGVVMSQVRIFLSANQFSPYIFKFFMCCFTSGLASWITFANYNHQKFFLRQLKSYDSIVSGKKIIGMATVTADLNDFNAKGESLELLYIYANLLGGSRSYVSSIVYLNRAYKEYNKDPMLCLILGLAHVHRSMQRLSGNRHIQLLQGISYLLEYKEHREIGASYCELQEIEYNFGRLFHMLGLSSLAINHYEKVLNYHSSFDKDIEYDLSAEAAYNMALIYNINGNSKLARKLTEDYLTI